MGVKKIDPQKFQSKKTVSYFRKMLNDSGEYNIDYLYNKLIIIIKSVKYIVAAKKRGTPVGKTANNAKMKNKITKKSFAINQFNLNEYVVCTN